MKKNILLESRKEYILENFDRALKDGWIEVYIQPVVRSSTGKVCEEEALARWDDPVLGVLNACDFVSVLEEAGLISQLDLYILDKVIEKMQAQKKMGTDVVITSINFSQLDFQQGNIVKEIDNKISKAGISKDRFAFEVSENASVVEKKNTVSQLEHLQKLGYKIEFDDFGNGDSSLLLSNQLHFDVVKINLSLTRQILVNDRAKIFITELVKMANALGIETIVKGVENQAQVDFLKEIGCAKLQGYYFTRPLAVKQLEKFVKDGNLLLGLENPKEAEYYNNVDKVSIRELSVAKDRSKESELNDECMPMAIIELDYSNVRFMRINHSFRQFMYKNFPDFKIKYDGRVISHKEFPSPYVLGRIKQCVQTGENLIVDDRTPIGSTVHIMLQKIACDNEDKKYAVLFAILSTGENYNKITSLSYNYISRALSEDYVAMYFVDIETNSYVLYQADGLNRDITVEHQGKNYFHEAYKDSNKKIYEEDRTMFNMMVTKENILKNIEENGVFSITYRANESDGVKYVCLKAVKDRKDGKHIIIGINNVDGQVKQQEKFKQVQEERMYYSRIAALVGDFYAVYCIDLKDNSYTVYNTEQSEDYAGTNRIGKDFFEETIKVGKGVIYQEDQEGFFETINKKKVLDSIEKNGSFSYEYRLMINDKPTFFRYKAIKIKENNEEKLIVGLINIDAEVRKEKEYKENLSMVEKLAIKDELTGVKNKHAYAQAEEKLSTQIEDGSVDEYAIAVFDLNGLKYINDTLGHAAGDEFIKAGCKIICDAFPHSPVYRIGGDEFSVIIQGDAYSNIDFSMGYIEAKNHENKVRGGVTIAAGLARGVENKPVKQVFEEADSNMYAKKKQMKY